MGDDSQGLCSGRLGATSEGRRRGGQVGLGRPCGEVCSLAAGNTDGLFLLCGGLTQRFPVTDASVWASPSLEDVLVVKMLWSR